MALLAAPNRIFIKLVLYFNNDLNDIYSLLIFSRVHSPLRLVSFPLKKRRKFRKKPCTDRRPHAVHEIAAASVVFIVVVVGAAAFGRTPADLNLFSLSSYHTLLHYFSFTISPSSTICLFFRVPFCHSPLLLINFYTFFRLSGPAHSVSLILEMYLITLSANFRSHGDVHLPPASGRRI